MIAALQDALDRVAADPSVRVVVLTGAGRAFCAGHDLKEMYAHRNQGFQEALFERCSRMMMSIVGLPQPVVARVNGLATAAGCQLLATCDLAVASTEARIAVNGIDHGLFCSTPSVPLSRNVARKQAFEMLFTGEFIDAETARARGLVNRVAPPEELDAAVAALCDAIRAKPAATVATGKRMFYRQIEKGLTEAHRYAGGVMACDMMGDDAQEGSAPSSTSARRAGRPPPKTGSRQDGIEAPQEPEPPRVTAERTGLPFLSVAPHRPARRGTRLRPSAWVRSARRPPRVHASTAASVKEPVEVRS